MLARRTGLAALLGLAALAAWLVLQRAPLERGRSPAGAPEQPAPTQTDRKDLRAPAQPPQPLDGAREVAPSPPGAERLLVRVLDPDGQPVGDLEVELLVAHHDGSSAVRARAHTRPADGLAELAPAPLAEIPAGQRVLCPAGFWPPLTLELGPELPREPVTLYLPAHGSLTVRLQRDGAPVEHGARVLLAARDLPAEAPRERLASAGQAHFPALALGLALDVRAVCEESGPTEPVTILGPRRAGEEVPLVLELGPLWPRVRVQVLTADDRPLAGERFDGWVDYGNRSAPLTAELRADAQGWLEFRLPGDVPEQGSRTLVLRRLPAQEPESRARLVLGESFDAERVHVLGQARFPANSGR